jgi:DHA3 family multidrug efflux protein-like MFS transporter
LVLFGAILGNMRMIALSTTVTMLVPSGRRDKANGLVGAGNGIAFTLPSVVSGLAIGQLGMGWTVLIAIIITSLLILHLTTVQVNELAHEDAHDAPKRIDIKGTLKTVNAIPGLLAIIFFATFNNFLGGIYMALMDPYGLEITSVEIYGLMWGLVSVGFIIGGWIVSKKGLGSKPLQVMFLSNIVIWIVCILFPIKSSIILFGIGMLIYMTLIPVVEAAEQTVLQRVVPFKKQGRVFGFAQSLEWAAAPITAFLIGPIAQFWVVPYMTTGSGAQTIGSWFGTGTDRGMALVFMVAGVLGLIVTLVAMASKSYKLLSKYNSQAVPSKAVTEA